MPESATSNRETIEALAYVIDALRRHEQQYRVNRWSVPRGVAQLVEDLGFRVTRGQAGSSVASSSELTQVEAVTPRLLCLADAAKVLSVSESTLKRRIRAGELHPVRIGGVVRLRVSDVDRYANSLGEADDHEHR